MDNSNPDVRRRYSTETMLAEPLKTSQRGIVSEAAAFQSLDPLDPAVFQDNFCRCPQSLWVTRSPSYKSIYFLKHVWFLLFAAIWLILNLCFCGACKTRAAKIRVSGNILTDMISFSWCPTWFELTTYMPSSTKQRGWQLAALGPCSSSSKNHEFNNHINISTEYLWTMPWVKDNSWL